jgi:hypothetical protein
VSSICLEVLLEVASDFLSKVTHLEKIHHVTFCVETVFCAVHVLK